MERTLRWLATTLQVLFGLEAVVLGMVAVAPGTAWSTVALVGFVTIAGPFTVWLLSASQGAEALGRPGRFRSEVAPVACFVPFVNAVVPYLMLGDIWRGAAGPGRRPPLSLPLWWGSSVAGITLLATRTGTADSELSLPALILAVSALLAAHAVGRLTAEEIRAGAFVAGWGAPAGAGRHIAGLMAASVVAAWSAAAAATQILLIVVAGWRAALRDGNAAYDGAPAALAVGVVVLAGALALLHHLEEPGSHWRKGGTGAG